jgi:hypothetical protein
MINYYILNETVSQSVNISQMDHFINMKMLTNKSGSFTKEDYQRFKDIVEKFKSQTFYSGYNLIQEQSLSIIDTFKMESGHWFACQDNHVYNIDQVRKLRLFSRL